MPKANVEMPAEPEVDELLVSEPDPFEEASPPAKEETKPPLEDDKASSKDDEEKKEPIAFRKLNRVASKEPEERKKRTWGDSNKRSRNSSDDNTITAVSSSELKDIIPDIAPVVEEMKKKEEEAKLAKVVDNEKGDAPAEASGAEAEPLKKLDLPKPIVEDPADVQEKLAPVSQKNADQSTIVDVRNLVRPFTNKQLIDLLKRTGSFDEDKGFWIDKIKSHAMVRYESAQQAEETVLALDGVKWPPSNLKKLIVSFSTPEVFDEQNQSQVSLRPLPKEDKSRNKRERERDDDRRGRDRKDSEGQSSKRPRTESTRSEDGKAEEPKKEMKSLETLFNKTKATPSIYWMTRPEK